MDVVRAVTLFVRLMRRVEDPYLRQRYWQEVRDQFLERRDAGHVLGYVIRCAMHYHHQKLARSMTQGGRVSVNSI
jgi:hypothetical protein